MIDLSTCDEQQLKDRLDFLYIKLDELLKNSGKIIEELGRSRKEAIIIENELKKRNVK